VHESWQSRDLAWLAALIAFPNFYFVDLELEMYPVTIRYCPGKSHQLSSSFDLIFPCISISMRLHIDAGKLEDQLKKPFRKRSCGAHANTNRQIQPRSQALTSCGGKNLVGAGHVIC
jgi:hypothetical protein